MKNGLSEMILLVEAQFYLLRKETLSRATVTAQSKMTCTPCGTVLALPLLCHGSWLQKESPRIFMADAE
jgi:hypothetical protein